MFMANIKSKYQSLSRRFRTVISIIRRFVILLDRSKKLFQSTEPVREIQHLVFSVREAMGEVLVNKDINEKIKKGYFADRLIIVAALPKSASSVIGNCIAKIQKIQPKSGAGIRAYARYMRTNPDSNLRPELTQDFPEGGVLKFHPRATSSNLKVLDLLGVKYVILLRHPVDHLVSMYCTAIDDAYLKDANWEYQHIYPLNRRWFQDGVNPTETIQYLICEGYLTAALSWIVDWLHLRDVNRSLVLRYEDFVTNPTGTLNNISNFLYGEELDEKTLMECNSIAERYANTQTHALDTRKYPHGWTGKIGIWKSYFSDENKKDYLSVVSGFMNYYPNASLLMDVYPNLLDIDDFEKLAIESIALTLNGEES